MNHFRASDRVRPAPPTQAGGGGLSVADHSATEYPPKVPARIWRGIAVGLFITGAIVAPIALAIWLLY